MADVWRCAGCGIEGPDTLRLCGCPTNVVTCGKRGNWKTDPECPHCGKPVDKYRTDLEEKPDD